MSMKSSVSAPVKKERMQSKNSQQIKREEQMERRKSRTGFVSLAAGLWMVLFIGLSFGEEAKPPAASTESPKAEAPAAAPAAAQALAPKLPTYFTATSDDPKKPAAWPDPTGAASGVWATPAGDGKGDIPNQLKPT